MREGMWERSVDPRSDPIWIRGVSAWHSIFWSLLALTAVTALMPQVGSQNRVAFLGVLGVLGAAYLVFGQRAARSADRWSAHAYLLVLIACCGVAVRLYPEEMLLLLIAFPQIWFFSARIRDGIAYSILAVAANAAGLLSTWSWAQVRELAPWLSISLATSLLFGIWIAQVVRQSEQRAELIAELDRTRDELAEANHAAGMMAERERMARDIHDTLAQGMTSIVMLSQTARAGLGRDGQIDDARAKLAAIEDNARENLAEARALVAAFTPVALADSTLSEALHRHAERFGRETGIDVRVQLDVPEQASAELPAGQQVVLLRSAQEALANVRKHASAHRVQIRLSTCGDGTAVEVIDDGEGFVSTVPSTGYGLAAMRGRVEETGGAVEVHSSPGEGTSVRVLVPAPAADAT